MKIRSIIPFVFFSFLVNPTAQSQSSLDLAPFFRGYEGCFVLYDVQKNSFLRFNESQCNERMSPCSTFKIPNSLIGLECGVIRDASHVFHWDGVQRSIPSWNRDHDLRSALSNSVVWYYQKLASEVGETRMNDFIQKIRYGNTDISGGITQFWLGSSLTISANEQVEYLTRFYKNELPFSQRSLDIVKEMMILDRTNDYTFRGKTGSGFESGIRSWGWFVGYVETAKNTFIFAANTESKDGANGRKTKEIVIQILEQLSLLD